ncbi:Gp138 family membrane-puncturing spike protein [Brenneria goodwinii]|uniref:Gp138 family membrane-puncturing spike protein n=1 Tax=Brenneria goodwinii TaxID=1109412 RepID=UPI0036E4A07A
MAMSNSQANPLYRAMDAAKASAFRDVMTTIPGHIMAYNPVKQRAQVQCGIQRKLGGRYVNVPIIINVPVRFSGTADWVMFHDLPAGTEGLVHFAKQSIDAWIDQGGIVAPTDERHFSADDAFFSPGYRSLKTAIPDLPTSGIGMSNRNGSVRIHLTDDGITLTCGSVSLTVSLEGVTTNGKTTLNGRTEVIAGGLSVENIEFSDHVHDGVETGSGSTQGPR